MTTTPQISRVADFFNGRAPHEHQMEVALVDSAGRKVRVGLKVLKDDNLQLTGWHIIDRTGKRHEIAGWAPGWALGDAIKREAAVIAQDLYSRGQLDSTWVKTGTGQGRRSAAPSPGPVSASIRTAAQPQALRQYHGRIFGGDVTAKPDNQRAGVWQVTWDGPQGRTGFHVQLQGQFGDEHLREGSHTKRLIGQFVERVNRDWQQNRKASQGGQNPRAPTQTDVAPTSSAISRAERKVWLDLYGPKQVPGIEELRPNSLRNEATMAGSELQGQGQLWTGVGKDGHRYAYLVMRNVYYPLRAVYAEDLVETRQWIERYGQETVGRAKGERWNARAQDKAPLYAQARALLATKGLQGRIFPEGYIRLELPAMLGERGTDPNQQMLAIASSMGISPEVDDARTPQDESRVLLLPNNESGARVLFAMYNSGGQQSILNQALRQGHKLDFEFRDGTILLRRSWVGRGPSPGRSGDKVQGTGLEELFQSKPSAAFVNGLRQARNQQLVSDWYLFGQSVLLLSYARALPAQFAHKWAVTGKRPQIVHAMPFGQGSNFAFGSAANQRAIIEQVNRSVPQAGINAAPVVAPKPVTTKPVSPPKLQIRPQRLEAVPTMKSQPDRNTGEQQNLALAGQYPVTPVQISRDKEGAISVKMSPQDLAFYNDTILGLSHGQLTTIGLSQEGPIYRAMLLQELHDLHAQQGADMGKTPQEAQRVAQLRKAMALLSPHSAQLPASTTESVLALPRGQTPNSPIIQRPQGASSGQIIEVPTPRGSGLWGLNQRPNPYSRRSSGVLLLPERTPFWIPNQLSGFRPGDKVDWTVKGPPDTAVMFVPDLHGHEHLLDNVMPTALDELARRPESHKVIVFLGDYINKGPQAYNVVEKVRTLSDKLGIPVVPLRGNHEGSYTQPLFAAKESQPVDDGYMVLAQDMLGTKGFDLTVESYQRKRPDVAVPELIRHIGHPPDIKKIMKAHPDHYRATPEYAQAKRWYETFQDYWLSIVPPSHTQFFQDLLLYYHQPGSDYAYFHSSGNPRAQGVMQTPNPWQQSDHDFMWSRPQQFPGPSFATGPLGKVFVVGGHTMGHHETVSPFGVSTWDKGTFPTGQLVVGLQTPDMLYMIRAPYAEKAKVHSIVDAIEQGFVDTGLSERNVIPNLRRDKKRTDASSENAQGPSGIAAGSVPASGSAPRARDQLPSIDPNSVEGKARAQELGISKLPYELQDRAMNPRPGEQFVTGSPPPTNWTAWNNSMGRRPARQLLNDAIQHAAPDGAGKVALDIGAGTGTESLLLLDQGYSVVAQDGDAASLNLLQQRAPSTARHRLTTVVDPFGRANLPQADLVWSGLGLTHLPRAQFPQTWHAVDQSVKVGGIYAGDFFAELSGTRSDSTRSYFTQAALRDMFEAAGYEIIRLEPKVQFEFVDGTSARAAIPIFEVIARKQAITGR